MKAGEKKIRKEEMKEVNGGKETKKSCGCSCPPVQQVPQCCVKTDSCGC